MYRGSPSRGPFFVKLHPSSFFFQCMVLHSFFSGLLLLLNDGDRGRPAARPFTRGRGGVGSLLLRDNFDITTSHRHVPKCCGTAQNARCRCHMCVYRTNVKKQRLLIGRTMHSPIDMHCLFLRPQHPPGPHVLSSESNAMEFGL